MFTYEIVAYDFECRILRAIFLFSVDTCSAHFLLKQNQFGNATAMALEASQDSHYEVNRFFI